MRTSALLIVAFAGCKCGDTGSQKLVVDDRPAVSDKGAATAGTPLASKEYFRLDAATEQPACQVDAPCEARLVLTALGDYHVNDQYPTKFVDASQGVKVDDGSFEIKGKTATMAIPFRASAAGTAKIAGVFKLSVCNDQNCQIETPKIAFEVPVRAKGG
jgi:hypothetical protein